ncbi:MAG: hypothetical protein KKI02_05740 [Planctomycetes bacterium]|nr:hypothetical protein [Planctomycetota bacterium]
MAGMTGTATRARCRGAAYVFFLGTALLVTIIGLSALTVVRIQLRAAEGANDVTAARIHARSAIDLGLAMINLDTNWRGNLGSGPWASDRPIGDGTLSVEVTIIDDGDGNAANNIVELTGTGAQGEALHITKVTLVPSSDLGGMVVSSGSWARAGV